MTPARFLLLRPGTERRKPLWSLRCACGSALAVGDTLDEVRAQLVDEHRRLMPRCFHRRPGLESGPVGVVA
jgi:hypothetical protein